MHTCCLRYIEKYLNVAVVHIIVQKTLVLAIFFLSESYPKRLLVHNPLID